MRNEKLNVTVHSNTSFTIYWKDNLIKKYVCYSVEWIKKGHKVNYKSFYENANNYRTLYHLPGVETYTNFGQPCLLVILFTCYEFVLPSTF